MNPKTRWDAPTLIARLGLEPLEPEGGWFRETWRTPGAGRTASTAIYYLLTAGTCSAMHRLAGADEVFHFYLGDPVELLLLHEGGGATLAVLGPDLAAGQHLQLVVPRATWQGAVLVPGGAFALMGTTCAPAFDYADCEFARGDELIARWPSQEIAIRARLPRA